MSLGKEGPTVFWGGGLGSLWARRLGLMAKGWRVLGACGAAAGLAAAFNTPIAAVAFVMEEMLENLNSRLMGRVMLASFVSVFLLHWLRGSGGVLELPQKAHFDFVVFLCAAPTAALAAVAGSLFQVAAFGLAETNASFLPGFAARRRGVGHLGRGGSRFCDHRARRRGRAGVCRPQRSVGGFLDDWVPRAPPFAENGLPPSHATDRGGVEAFLPLPSVWEPPAARSSANSFKSQVEFRALLRAARRARGSQADHRK